MPAWTILEELSDLRGAAFAGNLLARILLVQGSLDAASRIQEQIVAGLEDNGMTWCLCEAYWLQAHIAQQQHDRVDAWESCRGLRRSPRERDLSPSFTMSTL